MSGGAQLNSAELARLGPEARKAVRRQVEAEPPDAAERLRVV